MKYQQLLLFSAECQFLSEGQAESLAHLLASIHLQMRLRGGVFSSNTNYEYYVERYGCV